MGDVLPKIMIFGATSAAVLAFGFAVGRCACRQFRDGETLDGVVSAFCSATLFGIVVIAFLGFFVLS